MKNTKKLAKEERLFQEEMWLRSAVNSAGIEGNTLTVLKYKLLTLPLRRRRIYDLIKKRPYSSFDYISKNFSGVNPKTLHYDLGKLQDKWLIIKIGETRGVTYRIKNEGANKAGLKTLLYDGQEPLSGSILKETT